MILWDPLSGVFIDEAGAMLARSAIRTMLEESLLLTETSLLTVLGTANTERRIYMAMREVIKREYIRQYLVGIGGISNMTHRDWGSLGGMLKEQYRYLREFSTDLMGGTLTEAQVNARIGMYVGSSREAYNRAKARVTNKLGYDEVAWNLMAGFDHCLTCMERANMGYVPIGPKGGFVHMGRECFPGDGSSDCLTNDKCNLSYRNSRTNEEYFL